MPDPTSTADSAVSERDERDEAELARLRVELEVLREKHRWERGPGRYLTVLSSLIVAAGFITSLFQYRDTKREEFRRRFWERQLEVYSDASIAAARAATATTAGARDSAFATFAALYNGPLVLVASDAAVSAAKEFYQEYLDFLADPRKQAKLQSAARTMATSFKSSLAGSAAGDQYQSSVRE